MKRSRLKRISDTRKALLEEKPKENPLHKWMYSLWKSMPYKKFCKSCGTPIYGEFSTLYFDHLLEKKMYPEFTFEEKNIYFCCGNCHLSKTNGFPTENHKKAIEEAKSILL